MLSRVTEPHIVDADPSLGKENWPGSGSGNAGSQVPVSTLRLSNKYEKQHYFFSLQLLYMLLAFLLQSIHLRIITFYFFT
jgi:hypothetical protein